MKTSFAIRPSIRENLDALKSRVRRAGVPRSSSSDGAILEALILEADESRSVKRLIDRLNNQE